MLPALGDEVAGLNLQLKMGQPPWWRLPHFHAALLSGAYISKPFCLANGIPTTFLISAFHLISGLSL
jgi:hypothetical protein